MSTLPHLVPPPPIPVAPAPAYRLFDVNAVALATLFGSPIAGATLMFVNDRRMHRTTGSSIILLGAILVTAFVMFLAWNIPHGLSYSFGIILLIGMRFAASAFQGKALSEHLANGGKLASRWAALGIGIIFLAVIFAIVFSISKSQIKATQGTRVAIGSHDEVYYRGLATQADAIALGNQLKSLSYFTDKGVTVTLDKTAAGPIVSFVVIDGGWDQPKTLATFDEIGRELAPSVGGFPIHVRLIDSAFEVKTDSIVGKLTLGNDHVYFFGSATANQAQALADSLKSQGFFANNGADVFLSKRPAATTLAFIVTDGIWDKPDMVASFEKIARTAAPSIGGLPIHLALENVGLEVKKDEPLN